MGFQYLLSLKNFAYQCSQNVTCRQTEYYFLHFWTYLSSLRNILDKVMRTRLFKERGKFLLLFQWKIERVQQMSIYLVMLSLQSVDLGLCVAIGSQRHALLFMVRTFGSLSSALLSKVEISACDVHDSGHQDSEEVIFSLGLKVSHFPRHVQRLILLIMDSNRLYFHGDCLQGLVQWLCSFIWILLQ